MLGHSTEVDLINECRSKCTNSLCKLDRFSAMEKIVHDYKRDLTYKKRASNVIENF
jgi:hypothetical protein